MRTGIKFLLTDFVEKYGPIVTFGDTSKGEVNGVGKMRWRSIELKDVFSVKGLQKYLISISNLCNSGYKVLFDCNEGNVMDSRNRILFTAIWKNNIYML